MEYLARKLEMLFKVINEAEVWLQMEQQDAIHGVHFKKMQLEQEERLQQQIKKYKISIINLIEIFFVKIDEKSKKWYY